MHAIVNALVEGGHADEAKMRSYKLEIERLKRQLKQASASGSQASVLSGEMSAMQVSFASALGLFSLCTRCLSYEMSAMQVSPLLVPLPFLPPLLPCLPYLPPSLFQPLLPLFLRVCPCLARRAACS